MVPAGGKDGHNYMDELALIDLKNQMIAEINPHTNLEFIIMDGSRDFQKGVPLRGPVIEPGIMIASRDRSHLMPLE